VYVVLKRNMSGVKHRIRSIREEGNNFWYERVYLAMCFAAAAFQAKIRIRGVSLGVVDRYPEEVHR
jgi:hypothetical protein